MRKGGEGRLFSVKASRLPFKKKGRKQSGIDSGPATEDMSNIDFDSHPAIEGEGGRPPKGLKEEDMPSVRPWRATRRLRVL